MKRLIAFLFLFYCCIGISHSQWAVYNLPYNGLAYNIDFNNLNNGVSCGHTLSNFGAKIFYTTNSGSGWIESVYPPELRAITAVQYINSSLIYACGAKNTLTAKLFKSLNYFPASIFYNNKFSLKGITNYTEYYKGVFIKSTDAGVSWIINGNLDTLSGYVEDMHFFNANTGYSIIDTNPSGMPKFCKTTNAGLNWQFLKLIDSNFITEDMHFLDMNTGFLCGYLFGGQRCSIFRTTNGGTIWTRKDFNFTIDLFEMSFFNSTTGLAIGSSVTGTKIFRTTNTGITWDSITDIPDVVPQFIKTLSGTGISFASGYSFSDTMTVFTKTYTFKSTDYGLTWLTKYFTINKLITNGNLIDQNNFFMSGGDIGTPAVILKSTNGGNVFVNQIGNETPASFSLSQNYPNPFNPSTNIRYKIPEKSFVTLKIYDVLGKEVSALVNEKQTPGEYEVTFDGSSLNSGIYFCSLRTENFSDTKKMIMIK